MLRFRCKLMSGFLIICILVLAGCNSDSPNPAPEANPPAAKTEPQNGIDNKKTIPEKYSLTATEYFDAYQQDKEAARKKFEGQQIRLTGKVKKLQRTFLGSPLIKLYGTDDPKLMQDQFSNEVSIHFPLKSVVSPWTHIGLDQEITVEGIGDDSPAALDDCHITEVKGAFKPDYLAAEELLKEFTTDPDATDKKWEYRWLYLTGTIKSVDVNRNQVELGTKQKRTALLKTDDKFDLQHLKPGQKIEILGHYSGLRDQKEVPEIDDFLLIAPQRPKANIDPTKMVDGIPHFTAERLAEAFQSDPRRFLKRFNEGNTKFRVEGTIDKIESDRSGWLVHMKNDRKHEINFLFQVLLKEEEEALKVGNKVTIRGSLFIVFNYVDSDESLPFIGCQVVK
ncbi:tRNA_anti-like protein [Gimesia panareensis]|uniref:tRNA_anti-like protein n=1 Tax=Gimesia panareensis TaxID=2527978 RepID=A0A518FPS3_9PLAN|nr:hypothetical protein [Gimesia panareensis]QDV18346.1 tRNA_anti-like protein [Gimesia panareensis]